MKRVETEIEVEGAADEILSGLWWGDPEWPAWCDGIWREYVERMHEFNHYRSAVATLLRSATPKEATNG